MTLVGAFLEWLAFMSMSAIHHSAVENGLARRLIYHDDLAWAMMCGDWRARIPAKEPGFIEISERSLPSISAMGRRPRPLVSFLA